MRGLELLGSEWRGAKVASNLPALHLESQFRRTEREQTGSEGPGSCRGIRWLRGSGLCGRGRRAAMNVDHEVKLLVEEIHRLGSKNADGKLSVKFGVLFQDDKCANLFEALFGTDSRVKEYLNGD
ncbi:hypothetical protein MG293_010610 [Ovis ammon polii]|uniref:Costars family protein ABRACL n=1 Tax=Ovis ammon polii TaxID=230172 RepID=A0AAD4Y965_OVIAM|nr:hypothetical protein MG293_010610 [Ovis ammon polii]